MDERLRNQLSSWQEHIDVLGAAERRCLSLESSEKAMWASLFLAAEGKTVAEREAKAYASETWDTFQTGLVEARGDYNKQKRLLELKQAAFQSEYLERKIEGESIQRQPKALI